MARRLGEILGVVLALSSGVAMNHSSSVQEIKIILRERILSLSSQSNLARIMNVDRRLINRQLTTAFDQTSISRLIDMLDALGVRTEVILKDK